MTSSPMGLRVEEISVGIGASESMSRIATATPTPAPSACSVWCTCGVSRLSSPAMANTTSSVAATMAA
ncbi:hypothetical protein [Alkalisalibacterium limincola]|uniref:Uncharacterized protein n=1 Tax=Alkalisalibacterium limincola TaxID=2699169 RepID=A0A5C8KJG2_9GAMM|nr:hypothetical protein [Alkalisalibacterium limincola]TXK60732.1 hypothetical protein FU658_11335 [Alkalisalibacterium limincola]